MTEEEIKLFIKEQLDPFIQKVNNEMVKTTNDMVKAYWTMLEKLEARIETQESVVAQMVAGYAELAANDEAILSVLASGDDDSKEELHSALALSRTNMMTFMKQNVEVNQKIAEDIVEDIETKNHASNIDP